jgi:hypothetical protein
LRRDIEGDGTQIDLAIRIDTGHDEEDTRTAGATFEQATQAEDDGSFVFLHHLAAGERNSMVQSTPSSDEARNYVRQNNFLINFNTHFTKINLSFNYDDLMTSFAYYQMFKV